jgi:hypothetical protein
VVYIEELDFDLCLLDLCLFDLFLQLEEDVEDDEEEEEDDELVKVSHLEEHFELSEPDEFKKSTNLLLDISVKVLER